MIMKHHHSRQSPFTLHFTIAFSYRGFLMARAFGGVGGDTNLIIIFYEGFV